MAIPRMRLILAVLLSLAILVLGWLFGAAPQLDAASLARADRAAVDAQNDVHRDRLVELQAQEARMDETLAEFAALQVQIPDGNALPDFVDELTAIAATHSVQVEQYTAEEPLSPLALQQASAPPAETTTPDTTATQPDTAAAASVTADTAGTATGDLAGASTPAPTAPALTGTLTPQNLFAIPVSLSLRGTDTNVRAMLADLQTGPRLFVVTSAKIVADAPGANDSDSAIETSLSEVRGYVYVVPSGQAQTAVEPVPIDAAAAGDGAVTVE